MTRLFVRPRERRKSSRESTRTRGVGAYLGTGPKALDRADALEQWLGIPLDSQTVFEPWDRRHTEIDRQFDRLRAIWEAGRTPLLTWEPYTPTPAATPLDVVPQAAAGAYDDYLTEFATALAEWVAGPDGELGTADDRQLYLRPMHEANGDWYPWAPAGGDFSPASYVQLWRRLHRIVARAGVPSSHVSWIWAINYADVGDVPAESLFPGDGVVDLVGVDGYNWGATRSWSEWCSPVDVFGEAFDRVQSLSTHPVCVPEFGSTSVTADGVDIARKGDWLRDAFAYFRERDVVLAAYFDIEKETDWQVFGGSHGGNTIRVNGRRYQTYPGFRAGIRAFLDAD